MLVYEGAYVTSSYVAGVYMEEVLKEEGLVLICRCCCCCCCPRYSSHSTSSHGPTNQTQFMKSAAAARKFMGGRKKLQSPRKKQQGRRSQLANYPDNYYGILGVLRSEELKKFFILFFSRHSK